MPKALRVQSGVLVAAAGVAGTLLGGLIVITLGRGGGALADAEIAREVAEAGELITWELEPGIVCMRWGKRFQACDTVRNDPPPPIGLGRDEAPPTPLGSPRGRTPPPDRGSTGPPRLRD